MEHKCIWVMGSPGSASCGKKVTTYAIQKDDDNNRRRKYDTLCPEHKAKAEESLARRALIVCDGGSDLCECLSCN